MTAADLVDDAGATLGEGPVWDPAVDALVWVDVTEGRVHLSEADGRRRRTYQVPTHVGAALPAAGGGWLLATADGFGRLAGDGAVQEVLDVHAGDPGIRFNDAACDPQGRALAGTMRYDEQPGDAVLYRLDPDPSRGWRAVPLRVDQGLCNGIGWSPDGSTLYFVDSLAHRIDACEYDPATGAVGHARVLADVSPDDGLPDGLCVDAEGGIWVAVHGGGQVRRYTPAGDLDGVVEVPVRAVTCPAFGGADLRRLYVTTAAASGEPGSGGLWAADPGVTGLPATPWRS